MLRGVFKLVYVVVVVGLGLVVLEGTARWLGLGDPILYYNAAWGGMRPVPDQQVTRLNDAQVTVDANGFRSALAPADDALQVLYLGDSVTWGGTSLSDSLLFSEVAADVLRAQGHPVYAMNAGVNGTALVNHAELFTRYADEADAVVWLFPWSDIHRSYATVGPLWPARFRPRFALVEVIDNLIFRYWLGAFREVDRSPDRFRAPDAPTGRGAFMQDVQEARGVKNLAALHATVAEAERRGVPLLIGVTPYREGNALRPLPEAADSLLSTLEAGGLTTIDVSAALDAAPEGIAALFVDHVHFTEAGHRAVGRAVGTVLAERLAREGAADATVR